jgi:cytochrome c-type biogenesis protein CcmH
VARALESTARLSPPLRRGGREGFAAFAGLLLVALLALTLSQPLHAKEAAPLADDVAAEKRLVEISSELRCLVCQNESLSGSRAELAVDLRREIRAMIQDGKSDSEIMDFMVSRYGDFVRYRPPLKGTTLLLWFGPGLLFAGGLLALIFYLRRRNAAINDAPLSAQEQQQVERLLDAEEPKK